MSRQRALFELRRAAALVVVALLAFARPALAGKPPWEAGRRNLVGVVQDFLKQTSRGGPSVVGERLSKVIGKDPDAIEAVVLIAKATSNGSGAGPQVSRQVRAALDQLHRELGDAKLKRFLKDYKELAEWAKTQPDDVAKQLAEVTRDFTRFTRKGRLMRGYSRGAAYELSLAAKYRRAGTLKQMQPRLTGDVKLFRDALLERDPGPPPLRVYIEAKNWRGIDEKRGVYRLMSQVRSHFDRIKSSGISVNDIRNVPPGAKLVFEFNERLPRVWRRAIEQSVLHTLQDMGMTKAQAKTWVRQHLEVRATGFPG